MHPQQKPLATGVFRLFPTFGVLLPCLLLLSLTRPASAGWQTQWIDTFDGTGVDWNNWTAQIQANFNNEVQCYTDDDSGPNRNYEVSGGTLKIIARRMMVNCPGLGGDTRTWTSGRLNSKDKSEFLYGRIEARIRFLDLEGGTWPAFWMLENRIFEDPIAGDGDNVVWPNPGAGEIDVWEWFSNSPNTYITNFFNTNGCGGLETHLYPGGPSDVQQWHDYAIEWSADQARFFVDDTLVATQILTSCPQYEEPMFILLNVAMGGNLGGVIDPALNLATMEVDYVAHCIETSNNGATRCNESTPRSVIYEDVERTDWVAWDSTGATTPMVVMDANPVYDDTMEFSIVGSTVVGFTSRAPDAVGGTPYDASGILAAGTLEFDLKMTTAPTGGPTDWKLKLESPGAASEVEVSLTTSNEGHASPVLDTWQHYSFNLADLNALGLDTGNIDLILVFPAFGSGDGAVFRLDNVEFKANVAANPGSTSPPISSSPPDTTQDIPGGSSSSGSTGLGLLGLLGSLLVLRRLRQRH